MSADEMNMRYIRSITKNANKDIVVANATVCVADAKNIVVDLIKNKSDKIHIKEAGYLFEDKAVVSNPDAGASDTHRIRVGYTQYGFSLVMSTKKWYVLSQDEIAGAMVAIKAKTAKRYDEDFENWLPGIFDNDRAAIVDAFAGAVTHGAKDKKDDIFGVVDNIKRCEGVSSLYMDSFGDKSVNVTANTAVTMTAVQSGMSYFLQLEIGATINAVYSDGKPLVEKEDNK